MQHHASPSWADSGGYLYLSESVKVKLKKKKNLRPATFSQRLDSLVRLLIISSSFRFPFFFLFFFPFCFLLTKLGSRTFHERCLEIPTPCVFPKRSI